MSEIRVTSVVGENGGDRVGLTTGLTVGPLTGTTGIGATITHQGHAQFAGVCTATNVSAASSVTATTFYGSGANLTGITGDYVKLASASGDLNAYELIFDNLDVSTYRSFDLIGVFQPNNDAETLRLRYRTGGASGSNVTGSNYNYGWSEKKDSNTNTCVASGPQTKLLMTGTIGNHSTEGIYLNMRVSMAISGDSTAVINLGNSVTWTGTYREQGNAFRGVNGTGHYYSGIYPTGFQIHFGAGNIRLYSYSLYGLKR